MRRKLVPDLCRRPNGRMYVSDPTQLTPAGKPKQIPIYGEEHYHRWCADYLARTAETLPNELPPPGCTVPTLVRTFLEFAQGYYRKCGKPTTSVAGFRVAAKYMLLTWEGRVASSLRAADMEALQQTMVAAGLARSSVNAHCTRVKTMVRWGVRKDAVDGAALERLRSVPGLKRGRTAAKERPRVRPAPEGDVEKVLAVLKPRYRVMVRLQTLSGARPGEICGLRPSWIDRSDSVWVAHVPEPYDKTYHHRRPGDPGKRLWFGPRAQEILAPLLQGADPDAPLFRARSGGPISPHTYWHAVERACKRVGVAKWCPNRLRHVQATVIRKQFGLDAAAAILGHENGSQQTAVYAEREDDDLARRVAAELG